MTLRFNQLMRALIASGMSTPPVPPTVVTYGAPADAGEVNDSDVLVGARYYFDATSGLDTYNGLSKYVGFITNGDGSQGSANAAYGPQQTAVKMFDWAVNGGSVNAVRGSGFMLARGKTLDGFMQASNNDGTFYGNLLYGAYGSGVRPTINYKQSAAQFNANLAGAFFNRANTLIKNVKVDVQYSFAATAGSIVGTFADGDVITGGTSGATGVFTYNNAGVFQLRRTSSTNFTSGETISASGGSKTAVISAFNSAAGIVLRDNAGGRVVSGCEVTNSLGIGVHFSSSGSAVGSDTVTNCTISNACRLQSAGAGIDGGGTSTNVYNSSNLTVTNNTVYNCGNGLLSHNMYLNNFGTSVISGNWSYMTANVGNHALVIHGICDTVTIEDNLFEYCGNGLGINDGGYGNAEVFNNFTVRRNINRYHGQRSGQTQGLAMELAAMTNSAIYNNLSYGCKGTYSIAARRVSPAVLSSAVTISHETIYNCTDTFDSIKVLGAVTSLVIQNCIIMITSATSRILNVDAASVAGLTIRNCVFYAPNNLGATAVIWGGATMSLAAWMTLYGTANGCLQVDPLFTNAAGDDFTLQAGSPAKLAGYNSGITTDFDGNARNATTPSIGAYE